MRHRLLLAAAAGVLPVACDIEPRTPELRYDLNPEAMALNEALVGDPVAQDQIRGGLEMLFGTPSNPGYLLVEDWIDEEYDPNYGSYELSDEAWEDLLDDNVDRFAPQLASIEAGDFDGVSVPSHMVDLRRDWGRIHAGYRELAERVEAGEATEADLAAYVEESREDAVYLFEGWYPSLRESAEFYRVQCLHCHGVSGGGDGPTADFLAPRPRDYRQGKFKNTALNEKARPRRDDLLDTLRNGIYGTSMPNFARFGDAELNGAVDYVRMLSIRGETEIRLAAEYEADEGGIPVEVVKETYLDVWGQWDEAPDYVIAYDGEVPRATPEILARGKELFHDEKKANCASCHGQGGLGDGPSAWERNAEGELVRVKDDWGNEIIPRNLRSGIYRFGERPIDIFRRIYAGINGTPMPSHSAMKDPDDPSRRLMSDEDLWAIVHYVRSLASSPYPQPASTEVAAAEEDAGH